MNFFSYLRVELNRIFHSKIVYLIMLLTIICPMAGYKIYKAAQVQTISSDFIANPSIAGAMGGGLLFALLTLLEFNRVRKYQTIALTNSIVSPLVMNVVRLLSIGIAAIVSVSIASVMYFPYTALKMGNIFDSYTYWNSFFLLMLPSILLSILAASAFYEIFYRVDISMVLFIVFMLLSFSEWSSNNNILHWIKPSVPTFSDYFSNDIVFRLMQHNRLFWFLMLSGFWLIALLCVRRYGKGLFGSILHNFKKAYIPMLAIVLISSGYYAYINHPYVSQIRTKPIGEKNAKLKLLNTDLKVSFDTFKGKISGKVKYSIQNLSSSAQECKIYINDGYTIHRIIANGNDIAFKNLNNDKCNIAFTLPNDKKVSLNIEYEGIPKIYKEFSDDLILIGSNISDKYIDLQSYELFPSIRVAKIADNAQVIAQITMNAKLIPVVNNDQIVNNRLTANATGDNVKLISENGNNKTWLIHIDGNRFDLMAGDYVIKKLGSKDMPIEFYYSSKIEDNMKRMCSEKVMGDTVDYCIAHYGKLHNVSEKSPLKIVQKTAFFPGGLAFPNFSTMQETSFSDENLSDKSDGASSAEVLSHEIIHQWWGVQSVGEGGNNKNWSAEGLTVYTTYRVMKQKYGEEYAKKNYVDKWKEIVRNQSNNFYNRHPEYLKILPEKYAANIQDDRAVCQYAKMPLQILKATELVGGEANMDKILVKLYQNSSKVKITWKDFLNACDLKEEELKID